MHKLYAFDTYRSLRPILSDCVPSCNTRTLKSLWYHYDLLAQVGTLCCTHSLTINHPSDLISTIYPAMVCNKGRASCRFSHFHAIIMSCWILRTLRCPLSEGLQAYNTPECYRACNTHAHKSLWYTDQLNLSTSPVTYHHPLTFIYNLITHHPHFTHLHYHIHYRLFEWSFDVAGQHSKEPLPMSQNHIIRAWMSYTEGWVLIATNAYSELATDSWILCGAG